MITMPDTWAWTDDDQLVVDDEAAQLLMERAKREALGVRIAQDRMTHENEK